MGSYEAVKVRLDPTPRQERLMASHAGAARFAYNAGLAHVKEALDSGGSADWSHYALRRWWNANKGELAVNRDTGARLIRITVSRRAGHWHASLTVEREPTAKPAPKGGAVGVDLGVKNLATLSDGTVIPNPRALGARLKALRKAQQAMSRKVKGGVRGARRRGSVSPGCTNA